MTTKKYGWENSGAGQKPPSQQRRGTRDGAEFVDLELSKEEKADLKTWGADMDTFDPVMEDVLLHGAKVTFRYDERNSCYVAFGFAAEDSPNAGYILTGRGGSPTRALRQLAYKHHVLLAGEWAQYHNRKADSDGDEW